jgi:hypothetical protein
VQAQFPFGFGLLTESGQNKTSQDHTTVRKGNLIVSHVQIACVIGSRTLTMQFVHERCMQGIADGVRDRFSRANAHAQSRLKVWKNRQRPPIQQTVRSRTRRRFKQTARAVAIYPPLEWVYAPQLGLAPVTYMR